MKSKLMTKLALAAAVACAAAGNAHATSLYYTITDVKTPDGGEVGTNGKGVYAAYLFLASDPANCYTTVTKDEILNALSTKKTDALVALNSNNGGWSAQLNNDTTSKLYAYWNASKQSGTQVTTNKTYGDEPDRSSYLLSAFALILDSTSVETANNYMFATKDGSETVQNTLVTFGNNKSPRFDFGSQSSTSWTSISSIVVPEPTSGVLLLVGVAALALKRKKAA